MPVCGLNLAGKGDLLGDHIKNYVTSSCQGPGYESCAVNADIMN